MLRESDIIGHLGGDKFAAHTMDETRGLLIRRLYNTTYAFNNTEGKTYQLSLSVGTASYISVNPLILDKLMAQVDELIYEKKRKKRG